ncbi:MAG: (2Fe-2S)-binding protein [Anaerolineae bacterium]|nr:(2Fe-2S)-binding protein [Anaerolineae bacterium]
MIKTTWALMPSLETLSSLHSYLKVRTGSPEDTGWFSSLDLLEPGSTRLDELLTQIMTARETTDRRYGAMAFTNSYWMMIAAALGCYYLAERVPFISADNLRFHFDGEGGYVDEITFLTGRFYCLPGDPDAGDTDAVCLPNREALATTLRDQLHEHLTPVIDRLKSHSPLGKRALWAAVADNAASIIITATQLLGQPERCEAEIEHLLQVVGSPLKGHSGALWVEHEGQQRAFLKRGSCCLSYGLPAHYGYCATCPLLSEAERVERLKAYLPG